MAFPITETAVQQHTRHLHCERYAGAQNWRNNVGSFIDERGIPVRYGLANESKQENEVIKSSDIIGITPTLITQEMVGYWLGVFTALEIKERGWTLKPSDKRGHAQSKYHDIVRAACGYAGFVTDPLVDLPRIIGR